MTAEQLLAATDWLPPLLRTAKTERQADAPDEAQGNDYCLEAAESQVSRGRKDGLGVLQICGHAPDGARPVQLKRSGNCPSWPLLECGPRSVRSVPFAAPGVAVSRLLFAVTRRSGWGL